jgi:hypothetical protein
MHPHLVFATKHHRKVFGAATDEIALLLALEFGLDFEVGPQRARWVKNSRSPKARDRERVARGHDAAAGVEASAGAAARVRAVEANESGKRKVS